MKLKWLLLLACAFVIACGPAKTDDKGDKKEGEKKKEDDKAAVIANPAADLLAEYNESFKSFMTKAQSATASERAEVMKLRPDPKEFVDRFKDFATENPGSPIAASANAWLASNSPDQDLAKLAIDTLMDKHVDSPVMKDVAGALIRAKPTQKVVDNLNKLIEKSPHHEVKGAATHQLVQFYDRNKSMAGNIEELAKNPRAVEQFGEDGIEFLRNFKVDDETLKGLYETLANDYSDVVLSNFGRETNIGETAKAALFEMTNLVLGCIAPDIEGSDIDGTSFKLSEYRGKVVMLDFWGDW